MGNVLSDESLINSYVEDSIHNHEVLLSNPNLVAQSVTQVDSSKVNQLQTRKEGIVAICRLNHQYPEFRVRRYANHWTLLNQVLANHSFLSIEEQKQSSKQTKSSKPAAFVSYQYVKMPAGYHMFCTPGRELWRKWWKYSRKPQALRGLSMNLLIRVRQTWYPIQDVAVSNGFLFIKTLVDETMLGAEDFIVWLEKEPEPKKSTVG